MPQRRGSLEPSLRGPFGLSCLLHIVLLALFFAFPLEIRATYCVVGGGWWMGRIKNTYGVKSAQKHIHASGRIRT